MNTRKIQICKYFCHNMPKSIDRHTKVYLVCILPILTSSKHEFTLMEVFPQLVVCPYANNASTRYIKDLE